MGRAIPVHHGRPLYSRKHRGYTVDLRDLHKLRYAALCDDRITTKQYARIASACAVITRVLKKFPTPKPRKRITKRK